ncbi:hypothetical protein KAK07_23850 [Ideonella sp. 4Y16]|uniref:hypothetical protein n=1 Tax=Ideonella alba TaxID=2824118 RepID=UPI001B3787A7|nr:hypothetical protein [Ideonella alba]MBQ0946391.1 hypothetical protein [Ideonella alba]
MSPVVDLSPRDSLVARDMAMSLLPGTLKTPIQVDMLADVLEITAALYGRYFTEAACISELMHLASTPLPEVTHLAHALTQVRFNLTAVGVSPPRRFLLRYHRRRDRLLAREDFDAIVARYGWKSPELRRAIGAATAD